MGYLMFWSNEPMNTQMAKTQPISPRDQIITARAVVSEQIFIKVDALQLNEAMIHHVAHCVHVVNAIEHWFLSYHIESSIIVGFRYCGSVRSGACCRSHYHI
eukprot:516107_1